MNDFSKYGLPSIDELEINVIGKSAASGESIVVHVGNNEWMIIDSCKVNNEVLPLTFLKKRSVNLDPDAQKRHPGRCRRR